MTDQPLRPGEVEMYTSCTPTWQTGRHTVTVMQRVDDAASNVLDVRTANDLHFEIAGATDGLAADDLLAAYPVAGSDDASALMLPHVVLRRRTLPWERTLGPDGAPWVALVVLRQQEILELKQAANEAVPRLTVAVDVWRRILPAKHELPLLCHVRRVSRADREFAGDDDGFVTVVIGNRVPAAGGSWTACLIALDELWDQPVWPDTSGVSAVKPRVLHNWSFTVGRGGDFEMRVAPLRDATGPFGAELPGGAPLVYERRDGTAPTVAYHPPLAGGATTYTGVPGTAFSDDAMFELGRLLALSDGKVLAELQTLRAQAWENVWFKVVYTHFLANAGALLGGGPAPDWSGLSDRLREKLTAILKDLETGSIRRLRGRRPGGPGIGTGRPGSLDEILGNLPGGGGIANDLLERIRELINGGVTDPPRIDVRIDRPINVRVDTPINPRIDTPIHTPPAPPIHAPPVVPELPIVVRPPSTAGGLGGILGRLRETVLGRNRRGGPQ